MRLEQLLYYENICGLINYYTRRTRVSGWQACSVQRPKAMYSFSLILLACVIFIDGINSFLIIVG